MTTKDEVVIADKGDFSPKYPWFYTGVSEGIGRKEGVLRSSQPDVAICICKNIKRIASV